MNWLLTSLWYNLWYINSTFLSLIFHMVKYTILMILNYILKRKKAKCHHFGIQATKVSDLTVTENFQLKYGWILFNRVIVNLIHSSRWKLALIYKLRHYVVNSIVINSVHFSSVLECTCDNEEFLKPYDLKPI